MSWPDIFLLCFAVGSLWAVASLLLGGMHLGHGHAGHVAGHGGHGPGHGGVGHGHITHSLTQAKMARGAGNEVNWFGSMANPSCAAVFLAWFGGVGYLLTRHSGLAFWLDVVLAIAVGATGAWILAAFLRFLQSREQPLNPADYEMVGVLGQVSCAIHKNGTGEILYLRDGARKATAARSEEGEEIQRGEEVIVTRYEKGIAYVRTWEAITRKGSVAAGPKALHKEIEHVE
jgi:membrane protein implicated in regulation of membrane protease activity